MRKILIITSFILGGFFLTTPVYAFAVKGLTMTITPPLIKNNVNPGQIWKSQIKLVNNNAEDLDIYVKVADFTSGEENGTVKFTQQPNDTAGTTDNKYLLSQWIVIEPGPIHIPAYQSKEIPFIIDVPETAGPGGHYAAILAGTNPPADTRITGSNIKVSSLLASLILLTINGDVREEGRIREFSTDKEFYFDPRVNFTVRFENVGNVHIQPAGEITVYDFWNHEVGSIPINQQSDFGNVLPESIRKWEFSWSGDNGFFSMGRHRAELVLTYGESGRKTVDQTLYFWVIYPKPLIITICLILFIVLSSIFLIRRYVKKSILETRAQISAVFPGAGAVKIPAGDKVKPAGGQKAGKRARRLSARVLAVAAVILALAIAGVAIYSRHGGKAPVVPEVNREVNVENAIGAGGEVEIVPAESAPPEENTATTTDTTGEDNARAEENPTATSTDSTIPDKVGAQATGSISVENIRKKEDVKIKVLNGGGQSGMAGVMASLLKKNGYKIAATGNADNFNYTDTVIRYKEDFTGEAGDIDGLITSPVDVEEKNDMDADIIVIVGKNYE